IGARARERDEMRARLEHPQAFAPHRHIVGDAGGVPCLAHEAELIGWIAHHGVDRGVGQFRHALPAVANEDPHAHAATAIASATTASGAVSFMKRLHSGGIEAFTKASKSSCFIEANEMEPGTKCSLPLVSVIHLPVPVASLAK